MKEEERMARNWLSIKVELISGRGEDSWPRPARIFAAARSHTFTDLAYAINTHFARWDHAHLDMFTLADRTEVVQTWAWDGEEPEASIDGETTTLGRLQLDEQFAYVFDFGDDWTHLCTVGDSRIDPLEVLGTVPHEPRPYWGWGTLPDQHGRSSEDDDGTGLIPPPPKDALTSLPPILHVWGDK